MAANARSTIAFRESLGDNLLQTFSEKCDHLHQRLAGLGRQDWDKPCYHPATILTLRSYLDLRIAEVAVHDWDIRSRLDPSSRVQTESLPAIIDLIPVLVVGRFFHPGAGLSQPVTYRFDLTGPAADSHDIVVRDGNARMQPARHEAPDVTFHCHGETFVLVAYGRISMDSAVDDGRVTVEGNLELAAQF